MRMHSRFGLICATVCCLLSLQGCLATKDTVDQSRPAGLALCCAGAETRPRWLIDLIRPVAPQVGTAIGHVEWRKGYMLAREAAHQAIRHDLQPLDILIVSSKNRLSGRTIPGLFGHAVIYIGTEGELRMLGLWNDPAIVPWHDAIRSGQVFIEADQEGVHLSGEHRVLNTDRVLVLRPPAAPESRRVRALRDYFNAIGMEFDFRFDLKTPQVTFCTELVRTVMPELNLPVSTLYGTKMVLPEAIADSSAEGKSSLAFISYTRATRSGWERASRAALRNDLIFIWQKH